jgi:hypothetical protein
MNKTYYVASSYLNRISDFRKNLYLTLSISSPETKKLYEELSEKILEMENLCRDVLIKAMSDIQ